MTQSSGNTLSRESGPRKLSLEGTTAYGSNSALMHIAEPTVGVYFKF